MVIQVLANKKTMTPFRTKKRAAHLVRNLQYCIFSENTIKIALTIIYYEQYNVTNQNAEMFSKLSSTESSGIIETV